MGFRYLGFPHICHSHGTGLHTFTLTGLSPVEHTSLSWTHNVACGFPALRSSESDSQQIYCYSFESRFHDWLIFSLHRRPYPPFVWSPCFPRTIRFLPAASPCDRLSRSQSTISRSDFRRAIGSSSHYQLVRSYPAKAGNLADLPCSHEIPLTACRR